LPLRMVVDYLLLAWVAPWAAFNGIGFLA